jgi:hypothetical protein
MDTEKRIEEIIRRFALGDQCKECEKGTIEELKALVLEVITNLPDFRCEADNSTEVHCKHCGQKFLLNRALRLKCQYKSNLKDFYIMDKAT